MFGLGAFYVGWSLIGTGAWVTFNRSATRLCGVLLETNIIIFHVIFFTLIVAYIIDGPELYKYCIASPPQVKKNILY